MPMFKLLPDIHYDITFPESKKKRRKGPVVAIAALALKPELRRWLNEMKIEWFLEGNCIIIEDENSATLFKLAWI